MAKQRKPKRKPKSLKYVLDLMEKYSFTPTRVSTVWGTRTAEDFFTKTITDATQRRM